MTHTQSYTINGCIFQEFLLLLGRVVHSDLIRQMEYLKVENDILRNKCPKRITTTPAEKRKLIKYGLACRGRIKGIIFIVSYSTFRRWVNGDIANKYRPSKQGKPRKTTQEIIDLIIRLARENCLFAQYRHNLFRQIAFESCIILVYHLAVFQYPFD